MSLLPFMEEVAAFHHESLSQVKENKEESTSKMMPFDAFSHCASAASLPELTSSIVLSQPGKEHALHSSSSLMSMTSSELPEPLMNITESQTALLVDRFLHIDKLCAEDILCSPVNLIPLDASQHIVHCAEHRLEVSIPDNDPASHSPHLALRRHQNNEQPQLLPPSSPNPIVVVEQPATQDNLMQVQFPIHDEALSSPILSSVHNNPFPSTPQHDWIPSNSESETDDEDRLSLSSSDSEDRVGAKTDGNQEMLVLKKPALMLRSSIVNQHEDDEDAPLSPSPVNSPVAVPAKKRCPTPVVNCPPAKRKPATTLKSAKQATSTTKRRSAATAGRKKNTQDPAKPRSTKLVATSPLSKEANKENIPPQDDLALPYTESSPCKPGPGSNNDDGDPQASAADADKASANSRRDQVKIACVHCKKACKKCDEERPCGRCARLGLGASCVDAPRKERRKGMKRGPYIRKPSDTESNCGYDGFPFEYAYEGYPPMPGTPTHRPPFMFAPPHLPSPYAPRPMPHGMLPVLMTPMHSMHSSSDVPGSSPY